MDAKANFTYGDDMIFFTGTLIGIFATVMMDSVAIYVSRKKIINLEGLQIVPVLLGRWVLSIPQYGRLAYADIRTLPQKNDEARIGMFLHYLIGIFLGAGFMLFLGLPGVDQLNKILAGIAYGLLTNAFPWLLMYPAMGFGFFGWNLPVRRRLVLFSCLNHLVYGLALGLAAQIFL